MTLNELYDLKIFSLGSNFKITLGSLFLVLSILIFTKAVLVIIRRLILRNKQEELDRRKSIYLLIKYIVWLVAFAIILQSLGLKIGILLAGSAALLVGIGLGLQGLFHDFVSGIIVLADGSIKVNDIIEVNGVVAKVLKIRIRTTTVLTRDEKYIILPNSTLTANMLINWTHSEVTSRFEIKIGVDYSSDIHKVMEIIKRIADEQTEVMKKPAPFVRLIDFGDSSVDFLLLFFSNEIFRIENIKSEMRIKIFDAFRREGITIPFPQRTVHLSPKDQ